MRKFGLFLLLGNVLWFAGCGGNSNNTGTVTSVSVSCTPQTITSGETSQCSANVFGTGNFSTAVTWTANNGAQVSTSGQLSDTQTITSPITVTVTATSQQTPTVSGTANVIVDPNTAGLNVAPLIVDSGPDGQEANIAYTTVTVCVPGTQTCQTINHVQVDTGSEGLRLVSSVVNQITLPLQNSLFECLVFADGFVWGPVATADVTIAGETAPSSPVQLTIAPSSSPPVPGSCSSQTTGGNEGDTPGDLGANGILGVGPFQTDCGQYCVVDGAGCGSSSQPCVYYSCSGSSCTGTNLAVGQQVPNPVVLFTATGDDNGVLVQLPAVPDGGSPPPLNGSLIFGINTQSNNNLSMASNTYLIPDSGNFAGNLITTYSGQPYNTSFLDSGSNGLYFLDTAVTNIPTCSGGGDDDDFYCPSNSPDSLTATNQGQDSNGNPTGTSGPANFTIENALNLFSTTNTAFSTLGGPYFTACGTGNNPACAFDFGLPFFYGRNVFTAIDQAPVSGAPTGPFFAY